MSSKNEVHETTEHLEQRWFLIDLEAAIEALDEHRFDATRLKKLNVNLCHMALDQNSELKPRFFSPTPNLPQPGEILDQASSPDGPTHSDPYSRAYTIHTSWNSSTFHDVCLDYTDPWRSKAPIDYTPYKTLYQDGAAAFGTHLFSAFRMIPYQY